jgi:hypothetical protein
VLAQFWLRWQVQAPLRQALLAWRQLAAARHDERVLGGMADIHRERRLQQLGLAAFAANAAAPRLASAQHAAEAAAASDSHTPGRRHTQAGHQQQQHRRQPQDAGSTDRGLAATIVITHSRAASPAAERQQLTPGPATAGSNSSCAAAVVSDWRAAADYWRQRHQIYADQQQPQHLAGMQQPVLAGPPTATTRVELHAQWQQQ